jgi:hypothetical protein
MWVGIGRALLDNHRAKFIREQALCSASSKRAEMGGW